MSFDSRTIFAPATLIGESGITVTRVSGRDAFHIVSKIFSRSEQSRLNEDISAFASHTAHHGFIFDNDNLVDEALITVFKEPNSYTGEDVVEISTHGGSFIFRIINMLLVSFGAEHAEPGEFTKRAFLKGKIDLVQAEAVADLIKAKTDFANKLALKQLTGEFSCRVKELKDDLINYCSLLELELDFAEEGIELVSREELLEKIKNLIIKFELLTRTYESGKIIKEGINLAIVGKPNVGKSSIFNYLLNYNRAIVSEIPGTTRDYIQEPLIMGGIQFNLIDTAGIRKTSDVIEDEGVKRTHLMIEESDIVLEVEDLTNLNQKADKYVIGVSQDKIIKVYNKSDAAPEANNAELNISALEGTNMLKLQDNIISKARNFIKVSENSDFILTNIRHRDCLLKSCEYLVNAKEQIISGGGNELISFEIRAAMDALTEITGKTTNVDILNNIFSKFCIGK